MNLEPSPDQKMIAETFARFFDQYSSTTQVRAALPTGFDAALWKGLGEMGAFSIRVPEHRGGPGLGLMDAVLVMEEAGRTLVSGPLAEAIVTARLLARIAQEDQAESLAQIMTGDKVAVLALGDAATDGEQWVAGGAVAHMVIARRGDSILQILPDPPERLEPNLASTPIRRLRLDHGATRVIAQGPEAVAAFEAAIEEWKLLTAAALAGLSREALQLACAYASERIQFGVPIGTFQSISHPLADLSTSVDGSKYAVWSAIKAIADKREDAGAQVSLALWLNCRSSSQAVAQALHTFGGYGLTLDYDIHLFNLRAKAWQLILGDPARLLAEAGRRLYHGESVALPEAGDTTISFDFGEDATTLAAETRAFFDAHLTAELRAKAHYSHEGHDPGFHRKLADARLLFPDWPRELGGREVSPYATRAALDIWEEYGWTTHVQGTCNMVGHVMRRFGSDRLKAEVLSRVTSGEAICALGFSEPSSGSDVFAAVTRASRDGDGWRINGQKMFTSGANISDYVLLLARTDPEAQKHKGLTMFIVPLDAEGVEIQPVHTMQDELTSITYYDDVRVPDAYRLGDPGSGTRVLGAALEIEHGVSFVGNHRRMLRAAEQFCRETCHGNRNMISDPAVYSRLSRVAAHVLASTVLTCRSLWAAAEGKPNGAFGSSTKLFSSERYRTDSSDLLDLLAPASLSKAPGPAGFINQCYRHSQVSTIYAGTSEVHRSVIAERQLSLPRTRAS